MIDPHSDTWRVVAAWAEKELRDTRDRLETELPEATTAKLRERIAVLKELIALAVPRPRHTDDPADYGLQES